MRDRGGEEVRVVTDPDRLAQPDEQRAEVLRAERPELRIRTRVAAGAATSDFVDNGSGIPRGSQEVILEKFSRLGDDRTAGGAGLGLAICREIVASLGGSIVYLPGQRGAAFPVTLPLARAEAAELRPP